MLEEFIMEGKTFNVGTDRLQLTQDKTVVVQSFYPSIPLTNALGLDK